MAVGHPGSNHDSFVGDNEGRLEEAGRTLWHVEQDMYMRLGSN